MKRRARAIGLHPLLAAGIHRAEKARKADVIAKPMREMFALLMSGEVEELDGRPVMRMPDIETRDADYCAIAPAVRGWIDCWSRIDKAISTYHLAALADRLEREQPITPRLVEQAREEFEATISRIPELSDGTILSAITTTEVAWEMERIRAA